MKTRYWKWMIGSRVSVVYRLKKGKFEKYSQNRWQLSDRYERAVQDPEFVEIDKQEADVLITFVGIVK